MEPLNPESGENPKIITKKRQKWLALLLGALVILVVICLLFIVLFAVERTARKRAEEKTRGIMPKKICDSEKCLFAAVGEYFCPLFWFQIGYCMSSMWRFTTFMTL